MQYSILSFFLIFFSLSLFAQNIPGLNTDAHGELFPPSLDIKPQPINCIGSEPQVYDYVEEFPILKGVGCDSLESYEICQTCSDQKLRTMIAKYTEYPIHCRCCHETTYFVRFVINKKGKIQNIEILKRKGYTSSYLDKNVTNSMEKLADTTTWHPGIHQGKKVNTRMVIPIKFRLR